MISQQMCIYKYLQSHMILFRSPHAVTQLVEALRYKPEGHGFDPRWYSWNFWQPQPLREFSTRSISLGLKAAGAYG